jgi:hypothetical protein
VARRYLFSDESGDLQFRRNSSVTRYFAVGTLLIDEPGLGNLRARLATARDDLAWANHGLDSTFHATTDSNQIRSAVFDALQELDFRVDVTILDKPKAQPQTHINEPTFYKYAWYFHMKHFAPRALAANDELLVVAATMGTKKGKAAFRGAIEDVLTQCVPFRVKRTLAFWRDESDFALQAVDYCTWAVMRKWERGDDMYYNIIKDKIASEYDLWQRGVTTYY